jgi:hypothetical protein
MAIRRMYETFPALGIQFATPTYPFAMPPSVVPAQAAAPALAPPAAAAEYAAAVEPPAKAAE